MSVNETQHTSSQPAAESAAAFSSIYSVELRSGRYFSILKSPVYCSFIDPEGEWETACRLYAERSVTADDRESFLSELSLAHVQEKLTESNLFQVEYRRQADGHPETWCRAAAVASEFDEGGSPVRFLLTMTDITAEKELVHTKEMYEFSISGVDVFMWELDLIKDQITFASNPFTVKRKKEIGYPDVVPNASKYILMNVMPESMETMKGIFADIHAGKEFTSGDIHFRAGGDEGYTICRVSYRTVLDENGKPVKAYGSEQNITDNIILRDSYAREIARFETNTDPELLFCSHASLTQNKTLEIRSGGVSVLVSGSYDDNMLEMISADARTKDGRSLRHIFERGMAIENYTKGNRQITVEYRWPGQEAWKWIRADVYLTQNPENTDIEMFLYCRDDTHDRIQSMTMERMTEVVYDYIAVVSVADGSYMMQTVEGAEEHSDARTYPERLDELISSRIPKEMQPEIRTALEFDQIFPALEKDPSYVVNSAEIQKTGELRHKMRQFTWLDDEKTLLLICVSDVTAVMEKEKDAKLKLRDALAAAESANAAKSDFLSRMSHDIRTPMNAIIGFSTLLLKNTNDPEKVTDQSRKILSSSNHLLGLINDVLDMSKIETGKYQISVREFSLSDTIAMIDEIMRPQMEKRSQTFDLYVSGVRHERFIADEQRLQQVLINVLSNATKYTQEGGKIALRVKGMPATSGKFETIAFEVSDNGRGMSEEYQKVIFEPFSREQLGSQEKAQGTGLGMAITKNLVNMMGGTISLESKLGEGSTFLITLPMQITDDEKDHAFWTTHDLTHMLVVDDEEEVCANVIETMEGTGVRMEYALSGADGLVMLERAHAQTDDFGIVLLDWKMPGMDGVQTARQIRKNLPPEVLIIILTAYDYSEIEEEARAAGVDGFMSKPFFVGALKSAVKGVDSYEEKEASAEVTVEVSDQKAKTDTSLSGLNILAAEDNELNAEILSEILRINGAAVTVEPDGKRAVDRFMSSEPGTYDLLLLDIQMPVMNGYEAARAIRRACRDEKEDISEEKCAEAETIPIIAMTANAFADDIQNALAAGMDAHVAKPIDIEVFKKTIANVSKKAMPNQES